MKGIKKGEVVVYALALMLVTAGYYNYMSFNVKNKTEEVSSDLVGDESEFVNAGDENSQFANVGDAVLVNSNEVEENNQTKNNCSMNDKELENKVVNNNSNEDNDDLKSQTDENNKQNNLANYYANSKLQRDKMYADMISTYQSILNNLNVTDAQKTIATQEITKINNTKNAIMIAENLILNKGFSNCIIFVNEENVNIVVSSENEITAEAVAKIQNIISRELAVEINNIHISKKD